MVGCPTFTRTALHELILVLHTHETLRTVAILTPVGYHGRCHLPSAYLRTRPRIFSYLCRKIYPPFRNISAHFKESFSSLKFLPIVLFLSPRSTLIPHLNTPLKELLALTHPPWIPPFCTNLLRPIHKY